MLCEKGFDAVVQGAITQIEIEIRQGKTTGPMHPSPQEIRNYLKECLEEWKEDRLLSIN